MVTVLHNLKQSLKILGLPPEILIHILSYLAWHELLTVQAVSRSIQELVRGSLELRYLIELGADNLIPNANYHGSTPRTMQDRLNLLLDRRRRWRTLDWTQRVTVPLHGSCQAYELVGGVFAKSMRGGGFEDMWPPGSRHFTAAWLPTREYRVSNETDQVQRMVRDDLGIWTRDFAMDPTQDLLVLLEVDQRSTIIIHVRAMSSMEVHPLAARSPLGFAPPVSQTLQQTQIGSCFLQVIGDVVSMFYWHGGHCLRVWNWQTGMIIVSQDEADLPLGCWDMTFLSPRAYMIACAGNTGSLDLYTINDQSISRYAPDPPTRVLSLRLPELRPHRQLRSVNTHSSPHLARAEGLRTPFAQSQHRRIHLFQLHYGDLLPAYTMYVKNEYLLGLIDEMSKRKGVYHQIRVSPSIPHSRHFATPGAPEAPPASETKYVEYLPWVHWGPRHTRFLQQELHFQWLRYINGYRVVMPPSANGIDGAQAIQQLTQLCVFDFNVHPGRIDDPCDALMDLHEQQQLAEGKQPLWTYELKSEATVLPDRDLFTAPVVSALPYALSKRKGVSGYTGFMIDEQRLVGMKDNMFNSLTACDIDVFTL
ncbi:hypothetical protein BC835DRAFT_1410680 [Cytidiella melzeri]|nr:hypothetical protein BC835DRAFT_1410680 [Cytidiella melzeri]